MALWLEGVLVLWLEGVEGCLQGELPVRPCCPLAGRLWGTQGYTLGMQSPRYAFFRRGPHSLGDGGGGRLRSFVFRFCLKH